MQKVSDAYKASMKATLRERGYIMISFGLLNQEAQANASIGEGDFAYFSHKDNIFKEQSDEVIYATLEENFTKVDGSMLFLPRPRPNGKYYDSGIIGRELVSVEPFELMIKLNIPPMDFKGLTINFGENYPVDFDVVGSTGQVIEFRGNSEAIWSTEEVVFNTTYVKMIFRRMKNPDSRVRIYSIRFGYGLVYYNDSVMDSTLESYVSPIGEHIPQIDFTVKLKNYDHYFNVDNPRSAINYLETGQEMQIYYGYQSTEDKIEWIRGNQLLCSEWESDDYTATIRCQDIFRNMDGEYYKGLYRPNGISYYDLAVLVMEDAGLTNYHIDPRLKRLYTKNPMPRVRHKECLQIIANACRCTLSQTRFGTVLIKSNFIPEKTISANAETSYSNVGNVIRDIPKAEYASLATNYTTANGGMYFLDRNNQGGLTTGFVSEEQSDEEGYFADNPIITIIQDAACMFHGARLVFGNALPAAFIMRTFNNGTLVEEYEVTENIVKNMIVLHDFDDFDIMEIEFTKTAEPYNRIVLNYFAFGDITDFTMTRKDMMSSPKAIKQELIKEVNVSCYSYQEGTELETLVSEEVDAVSGQIETYFVGEAANRFVASLDNVTSRVSVIDSGSYYITVQYNVTGHYRLSIDGYRYKIAERIANKSLHARGKTIKWENPLLSDINMANDLSDWLADYYMSGIEYEYDTRGNPEIDVNDIVYQENEFHPDMKVNIYRYTIGFDQTFSGKVVGRRVGG